MWASTLARLLRNGVEPVSRWSAIVGVVALIGSVLLVVVDITLRLVLNLGVPGSIELIQRLLILIFFSGMAYTQIGNKHVRVDVVVNRFSPAAKLAITVCADLVAVVIVSIISWQSVVQGVSLWSMGYTTPLLEIPQWPWAIITAVFMALFALAIVTDLLKSLGKLIASGSKNYVWLLPGIIVSFVLFGMAFWPSIFLPVKIEPQSFGIVSILVMFALIFLHVPIGAAMAVTALWSMDYLASTKAGLALLGTTSQTTASNYMFSVIPLFIFMGLLVAASQLNRDLYVTAYKWLGHTPGGLASATVGACAGFAAVVGETMAGAITMSSIALPEMKAYKYEPGLATASIAAGGTLGVLIPPSIPFVVYGIMVEQSIGRLFIAGIFPGILMAASLILLIYVRCLRNPKLGPPGPATTLRAKVTSLKGSSPVLVLFLLVIGGIYLGIFTPTEAGAVGAFGALVIGLGMRRLTFRASLATTLNAIQMAGMIFFIFIYAMAVTQSFAITRLPFALADFVAGLAVSRYLALGVILLIFLMLGCIMNALPVIILTLPVIFPVAMGLGFDPIWFGVLVAIMVEIATITPPIGMNVFALAGVSDVPMYTIFRGVVPFWLVMLGVTAILIAFPQIALFLPNLMMGG